MHHEIILETERLILRKKVIEDAPFFFRIKFKSISDTIHW